MYNEIFNQDDFESDPEDLSSEGPIQEELDIKFPAPKERPSLDEMIRKYGFIIFKEWPKTNQEVKEK